MWILCCNGCFFDLSVFDIGESQEELCRIWSSKFYGLYACDLHISDLDKDLTTFFAG